MPTVLRVNGFRFFFYSNHLPKHIHVEKSGKTAKFLLYPSQLVKSKKFSASELSEIRTLIELNLQLFDQKWDEYFN
ncbi:DUF4160 domain-containing protein [Algoriphagus sp. NG3]|uniref:DUF4160 domain-containing protein n=1 Tax=Algoriphagus sp. NG3 TaxID=3097546 RepID=UPI002A8074C2|nr:DUF4160 domain-containing protein [Algoriphagus sp. NG3]WPR76481.1 DUF4160 domain-containing protein [Algoriphagus sp. NG3]